MKPILDMYRVKEDDRIRAIGETAAHSLVGVLIDDEPEKIDRYIRKVTERFPLVKHLDTTKGPTPGVSTLRFCPKVTQ